MDEEALLYAVSAMVDTAIQARLKKSFMVASFNVMVVTQSGVHYPNEMSYARFTLARGVLDKVHSFVHIGAPPPGYLRDTLEHMDQYHKIRYEGMPGAVQGQGNIAAALKAMIDIIEKHDIHAIVGGKRVVPIFAMPDQMGQVKGCFEHLAALSGVPAIEKLIKNELLVLDLVRLHYFMCEKSNQFLPTR